MNWDPFQRDALEAMGYRLYAVQGAPASPMEERDARPAPRPDAAVDIAAVDATAGAPLLRALLRAAGRRADDAAALALCRDLLPSGRLHDAASRRALWPRLRALRARHSR
ncbi:MULTISPECIES: hypothetical protein [unclassified Luteimonas]